MLKNYLVVAVRNILRQKLFSVVNILGLSIGMACCFLLLIYIGGELDYNKSYKESERIFRIIRETKTDDGNQSFSEMTSGPLGLVLKNQFPEIQQTLRLFRRDTWITSGNLIKNMVLCVSDPNLLDFFNFTLVSGNPETAFKTPKTVLLTESASKKLFGKDNPIGKVIQADEVFLTGDYTIAGIIKDLPETSTLQFDMISPVASTTTDWWWVNWLPTGWRFIETYILLFNQNQASILESKIQPLISQQMGDEAAKKNRYHLQCFNDIYLHSAPNYGIRQASYGSSGLNYGDLNKIYLTSFIAAIILIIACVNFINLSTARSTKRAKEVGLRKTVGSTRGKIIIQFFGETLLLILIATFISLGLVELALPAFSDFIGKPLSGTVFNKPVLLASFFALSIFISFIAGSYPALYLSSFQPVEVLKATSTIRHGSGNLRKTLVIFQFSISIILIIGMIVSTQQLNFIQNRRLGFDKEQVLVLPIFLAARDMSQWGSNGIELKKRYNTVKQAFLEHPNIVAASASRFMLGQNPPQENFQVEGMGDATLQFRLFPVEEDFISSLDIQLLSGRNFSRTHAEIPSDDRDINKIEETFIINKAAARKLGWSDPIGKKLVWKKWLPRSGTVIGIVDDFHFQSLRETIEPLVMVTEESQLKYLYLKLKPQRFQETLKFVEMTWKKFIPSRPFDFSFLDERLDNLYSQEKQLRKIFAIFSGLAVFISCLGLFGLASFVSEQRTREIGIRKILGASTGNIVKLLVKDFTKLVIYAALISFPIAYYVMRNWLEHFPYRIELTVSPFIFGSGVAFGIALLTVSYKALMTALTDPVEALRHE